MENKKKNHPQFFINPLNSPEEGVTVFTSPYLSAGAPAQGEAKGLINLNNIIFSLKIEITLK